MHIPPKITRITRFIISIIISLNCYWANAQDYYWVGNSGNWSDFSNHWATTSGGSVFHTSSPSSDDHVFFDANSFSEAGHTVTIDGGGTSVFCKNMDWTGALPASLDYIGSESSDGILIVRGSLILNEDLNVSLKTISLNTGSGTGDVLLDSKGISLNLTEMLMSLQFRNVSVQDSLSVKKLTVTNIDNTLNLNGNSLHVLENITVVTDITASLNFEGSRIYTKSFDFRLDITSSEMLKSDDAEIHIIYPDGFTAIDKTKTTSAPFGKYFIHKDHELAGVNPIFDELILVKGINLSSNTGVTEVEFGSLSAEGERNHRISFYSQLGAEYIQNGGVVDVFFADLENITTSGGADFNAYASTAVGSTSGWDLLKIEQDIEFDLDGEKTAHDIGEVIALGATVNSDLDIVYTSSNEEVAKISGSDELLIVGVGTAEITASQSGDEYYNEASPAIRLVSVDKINQEITFNAIEDQWVGNESINLTATSDAELPITYHVLGPGELDGNNVVYTGAGTIQVTASQEGAEEYLPAEDVIVEFEVFKEGQNITFHEIQDVSEDAGFINLNATADSGLPVTYSVVGPAELVDGVLEFTGNGMVQVTAMQPGDDLYLEADEVRRSFEIIASTSEKPLFLTQPEGLGMVYPNPVAEYLYFDPQLKVESIYIADLSGKVYYDGKLNEDRLDVSFWEAGTYVLSIRSSGGKELTTRIIKN